MSSLAFDRSNIGGSFLFVVFWDGHLTFSSVLFEGGLALVLFAWPVLRFRSCRNAFHERKASLIVPSSNVTVRPSLSLPVRAHGPMPVPWMVILNTMISFSFCAGGNDHNSNVRGNRISWASRDTARRQ